MSSVIKKAHKNPHSNPYYSPYDDLSYRGGDGVAVASFYETLFSDIAATSGFVYHGTLSTFAEDSAGTTEATSSGTSPVGYVSDISGLENHAIQSTSASKPVFYNDSGIKSLKSGNVSAVQRFMENTTAVGIPAQFTCAFIIKGQAESIDNWFVATTNYNGGWLGGIYARFGCKSPANVGYPYALASTGTTELSINSVTLQSLIRIVVVRRVGTGANQTTVTIYSIDGTQLGTTTGTQDGTMTDPMVLFGYGGLYSDTSRFPFLMWADKNIGADNEAALVAELVADFGAWSP